MANKQDYIAIIDDLLIHGLKGNHLDRLQNTISGHDKTWTEIIPKKCQLLMKHPKYMGNVFHINGSTISIAPL